MYIYIYIYYTHMHISGLSEARLVREDEAGAVEQSRRVADVLRAAIAESVRVKHEATRAKQTAELRRYRYIFICSFICIYIYIYIYIYICLYIYIYMCVYLCVYIIYTHMYISGQPEASQRRVVSCERMRPARWASHGE